MTNDEEDSCQSFTRAYPIPNGTASYVSASQVAEIQQRVAVSGRRVDDGEKDIGQPRIEVVRGAVDVGDLSAVRLSGDVKRSVRP